MTWRVDIRTSPDERWRNQHVTDTEAEARELENKLREQGLLARSRPSDTPWPDNH